MKDVEMTECGQGNIELKMALVYNNTFCYHNVLIFTYKVNLTSHRSVLLLYILYFPNSDDKLILIIFIQPLWLSVRYLGLGLPEYQTYDFRLIKHNHLSLWLTNLLHYAVKSINVSAKLKAKTSECD